MHQSHDPSVRAAAAVDDAATSVPCFVLRMGSAAARYGLPNCDRGIAVTSDQYTVAASRSRLACRYSRTRNRPFVDVEACPQPATEEGDLARIAVGEGNLTVALRPLAGVQRDPGDEEVALRQRTNRHTPRLEQLVDLALLAALQGVRHPAPRDCARPRHELDVAHPRDTELFATPSSSAMRASVQPRARSSRARCCSRTLPRYPIMTPVPNVFAWCHIGRRSPGGHPQAAAPLRSAPRACSSVVRAGDS